MGAWREPEESSTFQTGHCVIMGDSRLRLRPHRMKRSAMEGALDQLGERCSADSSKNIPYERFLETDWMLERWKLKGKEEDTDFGERIAQLANSTVEERWVGEILGATEVVLGRIHRTSQMIREARLPKDRAEWLAGGPRGIYVLATAKACGDALRDLETWFSLLVSLLEVYQRQLSGLSKKVTRLERTVKGLRGNGRKVRLEDRRIGQKHKYCQSTGLHDAPKTRSTGLQGSAADAVGLDTEARLETAPPTPAADVRELLQDLARRLEESFGRAAQRQLHSSGHSAVASLELWKDVEAAVEGTLAAFNVTGKSAFSDDLERLLARAAAAGVSHARRRRRYAEPFFLGGVSQVARKGSGGWELNPMAKRRNLRS
ncbi:hypothetical protein FOZ60_006958 [Perkinsus olseni]|uniref:Uncharacterized protein n=1 Tax=Perkinsus olseni TaxID=32597 RepID=A0A7J6PF14_PEROL|nr:hypothetical protein FOZ60_006958 [Perkinsus olseni]